VGWLARWTGLRATFAGLLLLTAVVMEIGQRTAARPAGPAPAG